MMGMGDKSRKEFEAFVSSQGLNTAIAGGLYRSQIVCRMWQAWLAAKEKYEPRWLTIESAPKKHTEILVCNMRQGATMTLVYYKTLYGTWMCKGDPINMQATHWMPLPPAPSTTGGGE